MSNFYANSEAAMWGWLAGEIEDRPAACNHDTQILAAIGGGIDPDTIRPTSGQEASMLRFARNLADMREELEYLRAKNL
jgi:hypothetical protein